jgi:replication factor A1
MIEKTEEIYHILLESGLEEEEIKSQIKQKNSEFQGLMSKDAILYLIAKEHGINISSIEDNKEIESKPEDIVDYNDFLVPISDITQGLQNIVIKGTVSTIFGIRDFMRKDGSPGRVGTFEMCDSSGRIKVVLWGEQTNFIKNELFEKGIKIQLIGGYSKVGLNDQLEVHLNKKGKIKLPENTKNERKTISPSSKIAIPSKLSIKDLFDKEGFVRCVSGIVHVEEFKEITKKSGEKTFLLKLTISDRTGKINVNIWDLKAVQFVKLLSEGDIIKISNVMIKYNSYSDEKEVNLTKSSNISALQL